MGKGGSYGKDTYSGRTYGSSYYRPVNKGQQWGKGKNPTESPDGRRLRSDYRPQSQPYSASWTNTRQSAGPGVARGKGILVDNPVGSAAASSSFRPSGRYPSGPPHLRKGSGKRTDDRSRDNRIRKPRTYEMKCVFDGHKRDNARRYSTAFTGALMCALAGESGILTQEDIIKLHDDEAHTKLSKYFSWCLRHTDYIHEDGSLSLAELFEDGDFLRKYNFCKQRVLNDFRTIGCKIEPDKFPEGYDRDKFGTTSLQSFAGVVNTLLFNSKGRFELGFVKNWSKGELPSRYLPMPEACDETELSVFMDALPTLPVDMVFIRVLSGLSKEMDVATTVYVAPQPGQSDFMEKEAFAVHGTTTTALSSIRQHNLKPGGMRPGTRAEIHFVPEPALHGLHLETQPKSLFW